MVFSFFIAWLRQAQPPCYSRCLSLSKAHSYSHPCDFYSAQSPCCFRCLSLSKAHSHSYSLWFRLRSITVLLSVPEPVEGTFFNPYPGDFDFAQSPVLCFNPRSLNRCLSTDWRSANEVHEGRGRGKTLSKIKLLYSSWWKFLEWLSFIHSAAFLNSSDEFSIKASFFLLLQPWTCFSR